MRKRKLIKNSIAGRICKKNGKEWNDCFILFNLEVVIKWLIY